MKKLRYILFVAAVAFVAVGCRKPVEVSFDAVVQEVEAQGGSLEIALKSNGEWIVSTTAEWITVSPTSGSGNATLTLTASANASVEVRTAEVVATTKDNSATLALTQRAAQYYLTVTPKEFSCGSSGGEFTVEVSSNIDWTVSLPNWITSSVTEGSNNASITLTVSPIEDNFAELREAEIVFGNPTGSMGNLTVSDKVHVVQTPDLVLDIDLLPKNLDFVCTGETKSIIVITEDGWTASFEEAWISLSQSEGQGETEVSVTIGENPIYFERQATVLFTTNAGLTAMLYIHQEASSDPHFLEVSPLSFRFGNTGGEQAITIGCDTDWNINYDADWLSVTPREGTGNTTVDLMVEPNAFMEPRTAYVLIKSHGLAEELTVYQEAGEEPLIALFDSDTLYASYTGDLLHVNLTSNTSWQLEASEWIILLNAAGEGDASFDVIVDYNSAPDARIGYLRVLHNGQVVDTLIIVQEGKPNLLETDYTEIEARPEGGEYTIRVTANQSWEVKGDSGWIKYSPDSGFGNGEFTIIVEPLHGASTRIGHLKVRGSTGIEVVITVTQHL